MEGDIYIVQKQLDQTCLLYCIVNQIVILLLVFAKTTPYMMCMISESWICFASFDGTLRILFQELCVIES
jgi:hypothetical protein